MIECEAGYCNMTRICKLHSDGRIIDAATFTLDAKPALVAYIMQAIHHNYNTWEYPEVVDGMYPGKVSDNWYYDTPDGGVLAAWQEEVG